MTTSAALVLGAAGFIGRHVCRSLAQNGLIVHGIGHGSWGLAERTSWGISFWTEGDITIQTLALAAVRTEFCAIINCAGTGAVSQAFSAPYIDYERTVSTTATALEFARLSSGVRPRVVLVSSAAVYGDQGDLPLNESSIRNPISPYGFSKVAAENLCESYSRFFDVNATIVRLFSVYGDGLRKQLLWDAVRKFTQSDLQFFGTGRELRDWIHVDDAGELLCKAAMASQSTLEIYNGGHIFATTREVLERLATAFGLSQRPSFSGQEHRGNPRQLISGSERARYQLGWQPRVQLDDGLRRYVEWFRRLRQE